uniref:Prohibitin n=1 Tax=Mola mola TaxID=94237 RepID=A0A3Q3W4J6_MOLML
MFCFVCPSSPCPPQRFGQHPRDLAGLKLQLGAGALPYGIKEVSFLCVWAVEGGHRAIISSRIGGMQMDTILSEGLHFMIPWFQKISSLAVLALTVNEVLKFVLATFNASQLITARAQVSLLVLRELFERAEDFNIILEVSITELQHRVHCCCGGQLQLGVAVTKNPAYLKLRRIRAAQIIAKMVAAPQNKVYLNADSLLLNLQDQTFINK